MYMYTLFKVCYLGTQYHGSQRQPELHTIEGEILRALHSKGYIDDESYKKLQIHSAGRTDAGVHARGMAYGVYNPREVFYPIEVNTALPEDIIIWSSGLSSLKKDTPTIHPRYQALQRQYKYFYVDSKQHLDSSLVSDVTKRLCGTHDFQNLSKYDENTNTIRTVDEINATKAGTVWVFDFKARSFLWHQIRKMMRVILNIGLHHWPLETVDSLLDPENREYSTKVEPVPPEGLILWDVLYPDSMKFQNCTKSIQRMDSLMDTWLEGIKLKQKILEEILHSFQ